MKLKIYLLERKDKWSYDDYDAIVVCAESEEDAKNIHPNGKSLDEEAKEPWNSWTSKKENLTVTEIGIANEVQVRGVVLASFNAG